MPCVRVHRPGRWTYRGIRSGSCAVSRSVPAGAGPPSPCGDAPRSASRSASYGACRPGCPRAEPCGEIFSEPSRDYRRLRSESPNQLTSPRCRRDFGRGGSFRHVRFLARKYRKNQPRNQLAGNRLSRRGPGSVGRGVRGAARPGAAGRPTRGRSGPSVRSSPSVRPLPCRSTESTRRPRRELDPAPGRRRPKNRRRRR